MKKLLTNPLLLLVVGIAAGVGLTRIPPFKNWKIIGGPQKVCYECYTPDTPYTGLAMMNDKSAMAMISEFQTMSQILAQQARDSLGKPLWNITSHGGFIHRDLLQTLLGSMSDSQERIGYYFGVAPGSQTLRVIFIKGNRDCVVKKESGGGMNITTYNYIATDSDSTSVCPPNCPILPIGPTPLPGPEPEPAPQPDDGGTEADDS